MYCLPYSMTKMSKDEEPKKISFFVFYVIL